MATLSRKLIRELADSKGQALAIAAVVACGVAVFVMSLSTLNFLTSTRDAYYDRYLLGDVFAHLRRAPLALAKQLEQIEGVGVVQTRIVADVTLDVPGLDEPAVGRLISLPAKGRTQLNGIYLRRGRLPDQRRSEEVLVSEAFFQGNALQLGDSLQAVLNGRLQRLRVVGVALSPEYVFQIRPGELLPDNRRFGIFWMPAEHLEAAFDMDGAFNDVSLRLLRGSRVDDVIAAVDRLLEPYGSIGAYAREDQISVSFLNEEIEQLEGMAWVAPIIFLGVAAFLLNVVLTRRIGTQREIIAALKAFGYGNPQIAWHYLASALLITLAGVIAGAIAGTWLASGLARLYSEFYKFPEFIYRPDWRAVLVGVLISLAAAVVGSFRAVRSAVRLMPAEAMRPAAPHRYHRSLVEVVGLGRSLPLTTRMILRQLHRKPIHAALSVVGISAAVAVLVMGNFSPDAVQFLMDFQFKMAQRQDVQVVFEHTASASVVSDLQHLPGVQAVEPFRAVAARMRYGHREQRISIMGLGHRRDLYRLLDSQARPIRLPPNGLVLSDALADLLQVQAGEMLIVEVLEGERRTLHVPVVGLVKEYAGLNAYADLAALHRLLREDQLVSGAFLAVDSMQVSQLYRQLKQTPTIAGVAVKQTLVERFETLFKQNILRMQAFIVVFAAVIAVGMVYNTARVSLDERERELSTMRVMGFTRTEVSFILLGELGLLTLLAIPLGWAIGYTFCFAMAQGFATEQYRIPLVIQPRTFALSALITLTAAAASGLIVRRRLDSLDLVEVLKSRE